MLKEFVGNIAFVLLLGALIAVFVFLKNRVRWIEDNHEWLGTVLWLCALLALYSLFSRWGFVMNAN